MVFSTAAFSTNLLSRCLEESEATSLFLPKSAIWDVLCLLLLLEWLYVPTHFKLCLDDFCAGLCGL